MATADEIQDSLSNTLKDGIAESQFSDRRERKFSPGEVLDALDRIDSRSKSPFIRVGFSGRQF